MEKKETLLSKVLKGISYCYFAAAAYFFVFPATYAASGSVGTGFTCLGSTGVLIDIGLAAAGVAYIYNYISMGFIFLVAASATERDHEYMAFFIPVIAALFMYFGWMVNITLTQETGIIICTGVLALAVYMKGRQQAKFGIAGPGSPFLNIVFWMIILQASIGFINATQLFSPPATTAGNSAVTPDNYQNIQLDSSVTNMAQTGGWFSTITSDAYLLGTAAFSAMTMIWSTLIAIVNFESLVLSIAPFLQNYAIVKSMLDVISVGIDVVIAIAVWIWMFKPPIGENV